MPTRIYVIMCKRRKKKTSATFNRFTSSVKEPKGLILLKTVQRKSGSSQMAEPLRY